MEHHPLTVSRVVERKQWAVTLRAEVAVSSRPSWISCTGDPRKSIWRTTFLLLVEEMAHKAWVQLREERAPVFFHLLSVSVWKQFMVRAAASL